MRPKYSSWLGGRGSGLWQFNADTHLIDWLEHEGVELRRDHRRGSARGGPRRCSSRYRVIVTGTHPEYYSTRDVGCDAAPGIERGGRLMYLGANGWYWRIAWHPSLPGVIEVRRAEDGIRTWAAEPGEYYHIQRRVRRPLAAPRPPAATWWSRRRLHRPGLRRQLLLRAPAGQPRSARRVHLRGRRPDESSATSAWSAAAPPAWSSTGSTSPRLAAEHAAAGQRRRATPIWSPLVNEEFTRGAAEPCRLAAPELCAPTSPSSRPRRAVPSSRPARSPGAARSRTTATTTTSPASRAMSSAASSIRRASPGERSRFCYPQMRCR